MTGIDVNKMNRAKLTYRRGSSKRELRLRLRQRNNKYDRERSIFIVIEALFMTYVVKEHNHNHYTYRSWGIESRSGPSRRICSSPNDKREHADRNGNRK